MRHFATSIFLLALMTPVVVHSELTIQADSSQKSIDFVRNQELTCTLTDGYVCMNSEEDNFLEPDSWQRMIPAVYMRAWQTAYDDFHKIPGLSEEQKDLKHYKIGFTENDKNYIIVFLGLVMPYVNDHGEPMGITSTVFGRSVKYRIDKDSNQIVNRLFYK
jgi:hypothetical protein